MIAVLAGPSMIDCAGNPDGMATCLRDKVSDFGLLPQRETTAELEAPAEPVAPPDTAAATPVPELTLLRAQPDGSLVIAGTAGAGMRVAVYANGELLGSATAEASGDWAVVPDAPLPPGGSEIVVREAEGGAAGTRSFVVVIDPEKDAQPIVVSTTPDEAPQLLQELAGPAPEVAEPATAGPAGEPEAAPSAPPTAEPPEPIAQAVDPAEIFTVLAEVPRPLRFSAKLVAAVGASSTAIGGLEVGEPPAAAAALNPFGIAAEIPSPLRLAVELAGVPGTQWAAAVLLDVETPAVAVAARDPFDVVSEVPPSISIDGGVIARHGAGQTLSAALPLPAGPAPAPGGDPFTLAPEVTSPQPTRHGTVDIAPPFAEPETLTLEAIEIDGAMAYFAGAGEEGRVVRLFIDDRLVGQSAVEEGRWLVEAPDVLTEPSQRIRVEMTLDGGRSVAARTEVDVMVDLPDVAAGPDRPAAVPEIPSFAAVPEVSADNHRQDVRIEIAALSLEGAVGIAADGPRFAVGALPPSKPPKGLEAPAEPAPRVGIAVATLESAAGVAAELPRSGIALLPAAPHSETAEPTRATSPSIEVLPTPTTTPSVVELDTSLSAAVPGAQNDDVTTIRATPLRAPGPLRFSSGKVIIRRGDTLWDIANRVYGDGYKYRTIYRANRDKIRRPWRIYPGQVFDIPLVYDER